MPRQHGSCHHRIASTRQERSGALAVLITLAVVDRLEHSGSAWANDVGRWVATAQPGELGVGLLDGLRVGRTSRARRDLPTVGEWLQRWLPTRRAISTNTHRSYESHIRLYLTPALGRIRLDRLRVAQIAAMFDAIGERNERIVDARASDDPAVRASVRGQRIISAASMQRIRATLRKAINDAIRQYQPLLTVNP